MCQRPTNYLLLEDVDGDCDKFVMTVNVASRYIALHAVLEEFDVNVPEYMYVRIDIHVQIGYIFELIEFN